MGAYGSPEIPPTSVELKYEDIHAGEEYDIIKCPKCGEPIKIRRQTKKLAIKPSTILKYTVTICLCAILISLTIAIIINFLSAI